MSRTPAVLAGALMMLAAGASTASASVLVLGEGLAPACSEAAFRGRADQASIDTCSRALEVGLTVRDRAGALVNRGVLRMADKDYAAALAEIDRGIALGVDEPAKAYYNRPLAQEGLGDAKAAWLDYRKAQTLDPDWHAPARQLVQFKVGP